MHSLSFDTYRRLASSTVFHDPLLLTPNSAWCCHIPFAFWLVEALAPSTLVELGVHSGVSYCAFCQATLQSALNTAMYGIDTWKGDEHAGNYGDQVLETLRNHHDPLYGSFSSLIRAPFDEAKTHFPEGSVDLLHIDGLHTYAAVRHDFETWLPTLSNKGVLLFHDIAVRERDFGVWRLWQELSSRYPSCTFPFGHGLGVLGVGNALPETVRWLFETQDQRAVSQFFFQLGDRLESKSAMTRSLLEASELRAAQVALKQQAEQETSQLHQELAQLEQETNRLRRDLLDQEQQTERAMDQIAALHASTSWKLTAPLRSVVLLVRGHPPQTHQPLQDTSTPPAPEPTPEESIAPAPEPIPEEPIAPTPEPLLAEESAVPNPEPLPEENAVPAPEPEFRLQLHYPLQARWQDVHSPEVSLIILNHNRADLTLACLDSIWEHTEGYRYEVILVDNGSTADQFVALTAQIVHAKILRIDINRYFGEGNNIGFEASSGRYIVFLNNDVTVTAGWLSPLIDHLANHPETGGTGPKMCYPDGRLQEAGAEILADGSSHQFGKGADPADPTYNVERAVMYISAAAFALRRETFETVLGFDLRYEPAYYEDSDLCMKIHQLGLQVVYCPHSTVIHHENATSRQLHQQLGLDSVIELNRQRFLQRWQPFMAGQAISPLHRPAIPAPLPQPGQPSILLYTPYHLLPGGGERYLLTIAAGLSQSAQVTLATPYPYSRLRLRTLGRELSLNLEGVTLLTLEEATRGHGYDWSIVMGNEAVPRISGKGRRNLYICQFPFPLTESELIAHWRHAEDYECLVVYSQYAQYHLRQALFALGRSAPDIHVVHPSAALVSSPTQSPKKPMILGVGRFFTDAHAKRQDLMIEAFKQLYPAQPHAQLHLAGSLSVDPEARAYYAALQRSAEGLPVYFHPNVSPEQLAQLYRQSSLYWHLSGYGLEEAKDAYRCEHFGITVVEAMSAGCIPLVVNRGGPPGIVQQGVTGHIFETLDELIHLSHQILSLPGEDPELTRMRQAAIDASQVYTERRLVEQIKHLMDLAND